MIIKTKGIVLNYIKYIYLYTDIPINVIFGQIAL